MGTPRRRCSTTSKCSITSAGGTRRLARSAQRRSSVSQRTPHSQTIHRIGSSPDGVRTLEWDAADRLVAVTTPAARLELSYNAMGQVVRSRRLVGGAVVSDRSLVREGTSIVEVRDGVQATTKRFTRHGVLENTTALFYTRDHLGSVTDVMDATGRRARHEFDPYGRRTRTAGDRDAEMGFANMYASDEPGLFLAGFRGYDSALGRWINQDPFGYVDGPNVHAYVGNDPINAIDPVGLSVEVWFEFLRPGSNSLGVLTTAAMARHAYIRVRIPGEL